MPFVENPTQQDLYCAAAGKIVPARGEVEVTEEVAAEVPDHVFVVKAEAGASASAEAEPVEIDPAEAAAIEAAAQQIEAAQTADAQQGA